MIFERY